MTFEDEKMEQATESLKRTQKMCDVDSLFEGILSKRPSDKWKTEDRMQRMIIWADCELFLAFLMFLKQSKFDFMCLNVLIITLFHVTRCCSYWIYQRFPILF